MRVSSGTGGSGPSTGTSRCPAQQACPTQHQADCFIDLVKRSISYWTSGNKNNIPSRSNLAPFQSHSHRLAHPAFDSVTVHGLPDPPSNGETKTAVLQTVGLNREHQQRVGPGVALTPETLEISVCSKAILPTHDVPGWRLLRHTPGVHRSIPTGDGDLSVAGP